MEEAVEQILHEWGNTETSNEHEEDIKATVQECMRFVGRAVPKPSQDPPNADVVSEWEYYQNLLSRIRTLSRKGFVNNESRKVIWAVVCDLSDSSASTETFLSESMYEGVRYDEERESGVFRKPSDQDILEEWEFVESPTKHHKDWDIVRKDVNRSLHHFQGSDRFSVRERSQLRHHLERMIDALLVKHAKKDIHYIQGLHDVCSVLLFVGGESLGFRLLDKLAFTHFRDMLRSSLQSVIQTLDALYPLVSFLSSGLASFLHRSQAKPFFALSWIMTWFAHDFADAQFVIRLYDFFLCSHPMMPLYMSAVLIARRESELRSLSCDCSEVHHFLQSLKPVEDTDQLIEECWALFCKCPPSRIIPYAGIDKILPLDSPMRNTQLEPKEYQEAAHRQRIQASLTIAIVFVAVLTFYLFKERKSVLN